MKLRAFLFAISAAHTTAAAAIASDGTIPAGEIIQTLLRNDYLLPRNSHRMLVERTRLLSEHLAKRDTSLIDPDVGQFLASLPGGLAMLENLQVFGPNSKAPATKVAQIQESKGIVWKEAKRRKVRYGPYRIPALSEKNVASEVLKIQGVSNTLNVGVKKPCEGQCTILTLSADLEYADGSPANTTNGAWLHHITLLNSGPNVVEPTCGYGYTESMFMSGNERTEGGFALPNSKIKSGYSITDKDSLVLTTELMNMEDKEKWAWVTVTYELLDGPQPDYRQGKTVFMSIGPTSCKGLNSTNPFGAPNITSYQQPLRDVFSEYSIPWTSPQDGLVLSTGGHMHDGGISTQIFQNGTMICDSIASYGKSQASHSHEGKRRKRQLGSGDDSANANGEHIKKQTICDFREGIPLKKGDSMYLKVDYDFKQHPGMKNKKGEMDEIMGIVGTIIAF